VIAFMLWACGLPFDFAQGTVSVVER
jgi:hypothetical protein